MSISSFSEISNPPRVRARESQPRTGRPGICFGVPFFPKYFPGGAEIQSYFIARHMLGRGWSVHFTTEDCGQPTARLQNEDGILVHKLKMTRFFNPIRCWNFYRELVRMNADIYYQRGGTEYTFATALAARTVGGKFIWGTSTFRDCEGNKFRRSVRDEGAVRVKKLVLLLDAWLRDWLISLGRKRADVIVVQSEEQKARMKQKLNEESLVIKSGHAIPDSPVRKASPPTVVWIANVKRLKRPEAFIKLAAACADLPAEFLLVGGCMNPSYHRQLQNLSRGSTNLSLLGQVSFPETNNLLAEASVLVNTSTREGFPNTFVQAWLRETPVVSLSVDPDGVLVRKKLGFCSKTFSQMVKDVRRLIADPSLGEEIGLRAKAYAIKEHNLSEKLKQYADLFEALYHESRMV